MSTCRITFWADPVRFYAGPVLLVLCLLYISAGNAVDPPRLSDLSGKTLTWDQLPTELIEKVFPSVEIKMKTGTTNQDSDYLRITPYRNEKLKMTIIPEQNSLGYRVEASEAWYWPELHLVNLAHEVVVSASTCRLEGESFDILLNHDTTRLTDPKAISLSTGLVPIESRSVRICGLGNDGKPSFEWDLPDHRPIPTPTPHANGEQEKGGKQNNQEVPPPTAISTQPISATPIMTIQILDEKRIRLDKSDCDLSTLQKKIRGMKREGAPPSVVIYQSAAANSDVVRKVQKTLQEVGLKQVKTVIEKPKVDAGNLTVEKTSLIHEDPDTTIPPLTGGRLLWCYSPGKYLLNGKAFDEPSLRQVLRVLARDSPEITLIIAGPRDAPRTVLKELASELIGYGFTDVQVAMSGNASAERKPK